MSRLGNWRCINFRKGAGQHKALRLISAEHRAVRVTPHSPRDLFQAYTLARDYWIQTCGCFWLSPAQPTLRNTAPSPACPQAGPISWQPHVSPSPLQFPALLKVNRNIMQAQTQVDLMGF